MAAFRVLTDLNVQSILRTAGAREVSHFANILTRALQEYSTKNESQYQPHRAVVTRPSGQNSVFMPTTSPTNIGVKVVGVPSGSAPPKSNPQSKPGPALEAAMLLCDASGKPIGVLNAAELTAFRTSLGSMLLFRTRKTVKHIVMFGSGKQAYWHLRLAIVLRGQDISTITIVNRSSASAQQLVDELKSDDHLSKQYPHIQISTIITTSIASENTTAQLKSAVQAANAIHCTVPSLNPLFPASWLIPEDPSTSKRDLYISAIGSYKLDMQELDPDLLKFLTDPSNPDAYVPRGHHSPVIVVDSESGCFQEAGEVVAAGLTSDQVLEIGKLAEMVERGDDDDEEGLNRWLAEGFVVYKSVGTGVMDLSIGTALIELANEKDVGVNIPNF